LPFFLVETGLVPLARLVQLCAYTIGLIVAEGTQGAVTMAALILVVQVFVYAMLLFRIATLLAGWIASAVPRPLAVATVLSVLCLLAAGSIEIYRTPFSTVSLRANLLGVFR
jgi:hypothetical protein